MRTSFHHQSEAQPPNGTLTAATSPDTPSHMPSHAVRSPWASGPATNTGPLHTLGRKKAPRGSGAPPVAHWSRAEQERSKPKREYGFVEGKKWFQLCFVRNSPRWTRSAPGVEAAVAAPRAAGGRAVFRVAASSSHVSPRAASRTSLAISIPRTEAAVLRHFQARVPYRLVVPDG